jgi:hypothetical protein
MREHAAAILAGFLLTATANLAAAEPEFYLLTIREHRFEPAELIIPADQKVRLKVVNADATAEEFESHELNREKVIPGNASGIVFVGPLSAGTYPFFGDFHPDTAQGRLVAK